MFLRGRDLDALNEDRLKEFLSLRIPEGYHLDYKSAWAADSSQKSLRRARAELLKDVTAFANAGGGNIIIGVKEPQEELPIKDQLCGIPDGDSLATELERLATTSIDPRIPGLRFLPTRLSSDRWAVIAHIPPSLAKPHRVEYKGTSAFYMRHRESSFPMNTHEIREAVLSSATAEASARSYLRERQREVVQYFSQERPALLFQATPLIRPEVPWDILSDRFKEILWDESGRRASLSSSFAPQPTIDGVRAFNHPKETQWLTEIHRRGIQSFGCLAEACS